MIGYVLLVFFCVYSIILIMGLIGDFLDLFKLSTSENLKQFKKRCHKEFKEKYPTPLPSSFEK